MKVVIIHTDLRVYWKGRLMFLHKFLKSQGIDFYAIELFGKGSPYDFETFNKTETWWDCLFPEDSCGELTKYQIRDKVFSKLDELDPDVIIAGSIVFYSGALGLRWAKKNKKKLIMFDDGKPSWIKRNLIIQGIKNLITNQVDALWLPSMEYDSEYVPVYSKENMRYLYGFDCIDNELFKFAHNKEITNKKIICVSRMVQKKNVLGLLEAWKFIESHDDTYTLIIIGDGPLFPELKSSALSMNLTKVIFLGAIDNDKIPAYLYSADAFISPSFYESWGLVVNEAMAAGLPVLLSDKINSGLTLLKDGENGYVFDPSNQLELQDKILDFIQLSDAAKTMMSTRSLEIIDTMSFKIMGDELLATLIFLETEPCKRSWIIPRMITNFWYGRYNTIEWNTVKVAALPN
ncbi:glycosyltransferase involved in cell wall biosynthesis [Mucilaginibacter frigoritolerans]|uniref:Glycosyltransferase involved in cell wall biosynthesis n=1 Tax=Mucilaginibacter frigoritolerans TaxID=652788 RepID=A0A562U4F0_9SPHI|nr:glycosyltransferase [Mucilaginibacter frigoritolerans]TWJ00638.1 glycosyltransferase involved in cell wall biosynthesis [Mucilaginibacter frigoritolerans]